MTDMFPDPHRCPTHGRLLPCRTCATEGHRDGSTYEPDKDEVRLNGLALEVWELMADGEWRTLQRISAATAGSEASVSARLRDFRKERFGGHTVERRRKGNGTFEYRVVPRTAPARH